MIIVWTLPFISLILFFLSHPTFGGSVVSSKDPPKHAKAWEELKSCHGVLVPGGFGSRGLEGKIQAIKYARWVGQSGRGRGRGTNVLSSTNDCLFRVVSLN